MYCFNSRVRYSEIDQHKLLDLSSIINYFQDCSTFHSEDTGVGLNFLETHKRIWMINAWQIIIHRFPALFETIMVGTWPYDFSGIYGYRNFIIQDENGFLCAKANSIWINMDLENRKPAKITAEDIKAYPLSEKLIMDYAPRKIKVPENSTILEPFLVVSSNIDTNNHVNNGQYVKMAENYLPKNFHIRQLRAEYRRSAVLGDKIIPKLSLDGSLCTISLSSCEGPPYAIIEFNGAENKKE